MISHFWPYIEYKKGKIEKYIWAKNKFVGFFILSCGPLGRTSLTPLACASSHVTLSRGVNRWGCWNGHRHRRSLALRSPHRAMGMRETFHALPISLPPLPLATSSTYGTQTLRPGSGSYSSHPLLSELKRFGANKRKASPPSSMSLRERFWCRRLGRKRSRRS